jgi:hypothetical protein
MFRVDAAGVFFDPLWLGTGRLNDGRPFDQCWHDVIPFRFSTSVLLQDKRQISRNHRKKPDGTESIRDNSRLR